MVTLAIGQKGVNRIYMETTYTLAGLEVNLLTEERLVKLLSHVVLSLRQNAGHRGTGAREAKFFAGLGQTYNLTHIGWRRELGE